MRYGRGARGTSNGRHAKVKCRAGGRRRRIIRPSGSGLDFDDGFLRGFFLGWLRGRRGLPVLLGARPGGDIERRVNGRRSGLVFGSESAAVVGGSRGDQAFDGDDHGEGLDLRGSAIAGHFGVQIGDLPEAGQDPVSGQAASAQFLGFLLDEPLLDGGAMLKHVGAHTRLGFEVGGGIGVKAGGFCGMTVGYGSREDQAGIGHFWIGP